MATDFFFPPELLQIRPQGAQAALRHAAPRHARKTAGRRGDHLWEISSGAP